MDCCKINLTNITKIYAGIIRDASVTYPLIDFSNDITTISCCVENRGSGLFTHDLPSLDDVLTDALSDGFLTLYGPLSRRKGTYTKVPRLFAGLWLKIFSHDGLLRPDADVTAIAFLRQLFVVGKRLGSHTLQSELAAKQAYVEIERDMRGPTNCWSMSVPFNDNVTLTDDVVVENRPLPLFNQGSSQLYQDLKRIQAYADRVLTLYPVPANDVDKFGYTYRHGPGSVADKSYRDDKYLMDDTWDSLLDSEFPRSDYLGELKFGDQPWLLDIPTSKLICVPKDARKPRLIASEPTSKQFIQQGIMTTLDKWIRSSPLKGNIDLHDQTKSNALACHASQTGDIATVDLSSASDRLSCWFIERLFRKDSALLSRLRASRTTQINIDNNIIELKKFASQGSATNFHIQSIAYGLLIRGLLTKEERRKYSRMIRVYGDDMIVPVEYYGRLLSVLEYVGLKVNTSKTFATGFFRESCGGDYYLGNNVTPIKPKMISLSTPESRASLVAASNALFEKGYWQAAKATLELLGGCYEKHLPVVEVNSGYYGLSSFVGNDFSHLKQVWDDHLQRPMYLARSLKSRERQLDYSPIGKLRRAIISSERGCGLTSPRISIGCISSDRVARVFLGAA